MLLEELFERLIRSGVEAGDVTTRYTEEVLTSLAVGAYTSLMFRWATHDGSEPATHAKHMAAVVADALEKPGDE